MWTTRNKFILKCNQQYQVAFLVYIVNWCDNFVFEGLLFNGTNVCCCFGFGVRRKAFRLWISAHKNKHVYLLDTWLHHNKPVRIELNLIQLQFTTKHIEYNRMLTTWLTIAAAIQRAHQCSVHSFYCFIFFTLFHLQRNST